jgi:C-terminal processing protease CtpA/Prc
MFPLAIRAMPNGRLVGTTTWGGVAVRWGDDTPYGSDGGSFTHNKFWVSVGEQGFEVRDKNLVSYEARGITPDETVPFNQTTFTSGTDAQLEAAIAAAKRYILTGGF